MQYINIASWKPLINKDSTFSRTEEFSQKSLTLLMKSGVDGLEKPVAQQMLIVS